MVLAKYSPEFSLVIFVIAGVLSLYKALKYIKYKPVDATVIEKTDYTKHGAKHVMQYYYEGYAYESKTEERSLFPKKDGETVKCIVNPANPEQIVLAGEKWKPWISLMICIFFGMYSFIRI